jgi:predicted esterase
MTLPPAPWKIPVSHHHGTLDMNFPIDTARAGRDRLLAAGHTVSWHEFDGGHTTTPAFALVRWDDLASSRAP